MKLVCSHLLKMSFISGQFSSASFVRMWRCPDDVLLRLQRVQHVLICQCMIFKKKHSLWMSFIWFRAIFYSSFTFHRQKSAGVSNQLINNGHLWSLWQWASMHITGVLNLKQLNRIQTPFIILLTPVFFHWWYDEIFCAKGIHLLLVRHA